MAHGRSSSAGSDTATMHGYVNVPGLPLDRLGGLQSQEEKRLFELVDRLKDLDVEQELHLPQLVVCGSQSSGKSSVLEAISGLQFPRGELTCTKFVTELRFRAGQTEAIDVQIIPDAARSSDDQTRLKGIKFRSRKLTELASMVKEAEKILGLSGRSGFARDVLRVHVVRPNQQPLTIIDTPGLIASHNEGREHIDLVKQIVDDWISQPMSLILAVVEANLDPQKQSVLTTAKEVDPSGERTFGIITKPDLCETGSQLEAYWIEKARNLTDRRSEFRFQMGWHALRNRGVRETGNDTSSAERDEMERQFFLNRERAWSKVDESSWGIESLQSRLRQIYYGYTKKQLPGIRNTVSMRLQSSIKELGTINARLVDPEETWIKFMKHCTGLAVRAKDRADGTYLDEGSAEWSRAPEYYLRSRIEEDHDDFSHAMEYNGHGLRQQGSGNSLVEDNESFRDYVQRMLDATRGQELPESYNSQRLNLLFREHSERWYDIAKVHTERTYNRCVEFVDYIIDKDLRHRLPALPAAVADAIKMHLRDSLTKQKKLAEEELDALEEDRMQPAKTQSRRFAKLSQQLRSNALFASVNRIAESEEQFQRSPSNETVQNTAATARFTPGYLDRILAQDSGTSAAEEMGGRMIIYYEIAREVFVDNVVVQVVERHLLRPLHTLFQGDFGVSKDFFCLSAGDERDQSLVAKKGQLEERVKRLNAFHDQLKS